MQYRRFLLFTLAMLVLLAGTASVITTTASADVVIPKAMPKALRSAPLRTNDVGDPDTVWIGHVQTPTGLPGTAGGFGPYKIGRGPRMIGGGAGTSNNGVWTWDHFQGGSDSDSLFGWWPVASPYASVGGSNFNDKQRTMFGMDHGNQGNHERLLHGATPRTFGVTGYWHRDPGSNVAGLPDTGAVVAGPDVEWAPLAGGFSAWCGLRGHGDVTAIDAVVNGGTGNPINQSVVERTGNNTQGSTFGQIGSDSPLGTDKNFPGYGSQWDQMLYRDIVLADGATLAVSFLYRTNMSTDKNTASATRTGWFDKDPLLSGGSSPNMVQPNDGNWISSSDAGNDAPIDSFMVYIGAPVEPVVGPSNDFVASDGLSYELYDVKRRWFSEVIRINQPYNEILTKSGVTATTTFSQTIPNSVIQPILNAQAGAGGTVRLAFRVKTNRGFDDEDNATSGFSSGTAGAAIVDNVVLNGWAAANGNFEATNAIDNSGGSPATSAWKSTGKPPGAYFHSVDLSTLSYTDPCGAIGAPNRLCNMIGRVVSAGDADNSEKPGGEFGATDQDRLHLLASPTINLMSTGPGDYNGMGIDAEIADATGDFMIDFDLYTNVYQFAVGGTANGIRLNWQSYPARQPNGLNVWGEISRTLAFASYDGILGCYDLVDFGSPTFLPPGGLARQDGVIVTSNANNIPDSLRVYIEHVVICFRRPVTGATCSPNSGAFAGGWIDNVAVALIDAPPPPGLAIAIWDVYQDAFPVNDGDDIPINTPAFDTLAAQMRSGFNTGDQTGDLSRQTVPGDSALVDAGGANKRVDLVFRILPGVGNYRSIGNRASGLRKRPDQGGAAGNAVAAGDGSFWGEYLASNGTFGSPGGHPGGGTVWSEHVWNSARMDTVEINFFPANSVQASLNQLRSGSYQTTYHESDAKFTTLGVVKNRCFISNLNQSSVNADNTNCGNGTTPPDGGVYPPAWTGGAGSGFNANEIVGLPGRTREFTKILPDGQLTAGAHLQYFFRKSDLASPATFEMLPDTHVVFPQRAAGQFDGTRWYHNSVLPDRWKDGAFGGSGMACMLVVELGDRRGDELNWVSMADSIGLTAASRRGAHNGWKARGDQALQDPAGNPLVISGDPTIAVATHGGQPGTVWDNFGVVAGESNVPAGRLGSRVGPRPVGQLTTGKYSNHGPSEAMLLGYYRMIIFLAEDLGANSIGPIPDQTDNDIGILTAFMTNPAGSATPRGVIAVGRDLVEGQDADHPTFFPTFFGASLRDPDYRALSGVARDVPDLLAQSNINSASGIYGVFSPCFLTNDVYNVESGVPTAAVGVYYENLGASGPYVAGVYAPEGGARIARTLVEGWSLQNPQGSQNILLTHGAQKFWLQQLTNVFVSLNCGPGLQAPVVDVGDGWNSGRPFVEFMNLRSSNPMRSGEARIAFGITKTEKVEVRIYDVSGRLVKTVANRTFAGGQEHVVTWDGTNDAGHGVARGVYFYQLRSPSFTSQKKLAVLKN